MKTRVNVPLEALPKRYSDLCQVMLPRPIHDEVGYANTVELANAFAGFEEQLTDDQNDYFDLLCDLIEKYERENTTFPQLSALKLLKHLLEEHQLSAVDLSRILGKSAPLGRKILSCERRITADHAVALAR